MRIYVLQTPFKCKLLMYIYCAKTSITCRVEMKMYSSFSRWSTLSERLAHPGQPSVCYYLKLNHSDFHNFEIFFKKQYTYIHTYLMQRSKVGVINLNVKLYVKFVIQTSRNINFTHKLLQSRELICVRKIFKATSAVNNINRELIKLN